jgi:hypothetical protein
MRSAENQVALQSGVSLPAETQVLRVVQTGGLAMVGTLAKLLVDKGIVTDAELQAALNAAVAEPWPGEPVNPPPGP